MSMDLSVVVDVRRIRLAFRDLGVMANDGTIARIAAGALRSSTDFAFEDEQDPVTGQSWEDWSEPYLEWRRDHGFVPGSKLKLTGDMARSITTDSGPDWAMLGSPKVCAAIHQWGGTSGMAPGPAGIPARPHMGLDDAGEQDIYDAIRKRVSAAMNA